MPLTDSMATPAARSAGVPRSVAWWVLVASALAVAAIGLTTTAAVFTVLPPRQQPIPPAFWLAVTGGAIFTCGSLGLRTLRWVFLLRRAGARIPLRDACVAYLSGFVLLFVPLLAGEIAVRAYMHRARARVPLTTTTALGLWERLLDTTALALIAAFALAAMGFAHTAVLPLTLVAATSTRSFRQAILRVIVAVSRFAVRRFGPAEREVTTASLAGVSEHAVWTAALGTSVVAWLLPGVALWAMAASVHGTFDLLHAQFAYASSALSGGLMLAPGGVRVVGGSLIAYLSANGLAEPDTAIVVLAIRLVTAGLSIVLGAMFVWIHVRTRPLTSDSHFDDIAHAYDAQIPPAQRESLLARKTTLMQRAIASGGAKGLDVGCGQGWYVARMRQLGFDVHGIDASAGQIARAREHVDQPGCITEGSVLRIDAPDSSYDFAYTINVLHHLASVDEQRAAFAELLRVLRPGGLLFVHEINTRNIVFRFYMGYVFPSLNCIDEGTERWLLPHRLDTYTSAPVVETAYFTFMPEFVPGPVLRLFRPLEALLEASPLRVFSAHYMAVLRKPSATT